MPHSRTFGGKRTIAIDVWERLGSPTQYIEPFCGSAAMLLAAPKTASLEVVCDASGFIANFWRAVKNQPGKVAEWADYPVSHVDLGARHRWLMEAREPLAPLLQDADWPGDAKVAGWWLWGQCAWIGSGWCEWSGHNSATTPNGRIPAPGGDGGPGQGYGSPGAAKRYGKVPHASNAGMGIQAIGKVPHVSDAGVGDAVLWTSAGRTAWKWLHELADRLERVRVMHGDWSRCLNHHYGASDTAVFLDPPYRAYERLYGTEAPVADAVAAWAKEHPHLRVALCGHVGDYDLPGWDAVQWSRSGNTYGGDKTKDAECVWYSPGCLPRAQMGLFDR